MKPAIYILTNFDRPALYVGMTNNLPRRLCEHKQKLMPGFTKQYNLTRLIDYEFFARRTDAIEREKAINATVRRRQTRRHSNLIELT